MLVGVAPAMVSCYLVVVVATMVASGGSYWEHFGATNLVKGNAFE